MEVNDKLTYSGIVDVKRVSNNKINKFTVHNSSTTEMSLIFAKALLNQSVTRYIPTQLDLGYSELSGTWVSVLTKLKPLTGGQYKLNGERYTTTYDVLITKENMISGVSSSVDLKARLLTSNNVVLAEVDLESTPSIITPSTSLQIVWNLTLVDQEQS